jgi:deazaflavin-dependent oxidoreductase (nitroreductase family)
MSVPDGVNEWNRQVIAEFRANGGKVGGRFAGARIVLVHHFGAKSGTERVSPMVYFPDGDRMLVIASAAGMPKNPEWYHNLKAHPHVDVESAASGSPSPSRSSAARSATRSGRRSPRRCPGSPSTSGRPRG